MTFSTENDTLTISKVKELSVSNANALEKDALNALGRSCTKIILNLEETGFMDSCGWAALMNLAIICQKRNGRLSIIKSKGPVLQILQLTRIYRVCEIVT